MDPYFQERLNAITETVSWGDILSNGKEKGTVDCPFCNRKGKAYLYPNYFKCFSSHCEIKGSKIAIYQRMHNISFMQAVLKLEDTHYLDPRKQQEEVKQRDELLNECLDAYHHELLNNEEALNYLYERGFELETIKLWRIGYASNNSILSLYNVPYKSLFRQKLSKNNREFFEKRIIFPIYNYQGSLIHLTGRRFPSIPNDEWKYLDSPAVPIIGSSKDYLLFENELDSYLNRRDEVLYITEGVPDTFILKQLGYPVVGLMGLAKLLYQGLKKLEGFKHIVAIFDNDRFDKDHPNFPNEKKSWRVVEEQLVDLQLYLGMDTKIYCCEIPEFLQFKDGYVKDINDLYLYSNKDNSFVEKIIKENSIDIIQFMIDKYGGDLSKHEILLKLISATNRGEELIQPFIPEDFTPLKYAIKVLRS